MRILIVYHYRLGDIARCLPIAEYFARQGHDVIIECADCYHGLFAMVDYATPCFPGMDQTLFDRVLDLQIWPNRFDDFVASGKPWWEYVMSLFPEGANIGRRIRLNRPPIVVPPHVSESVVCFPCGYSQTNPMPILRVIGIAHVFARGRPVIALGKQEHGLTELSSIEELCAYIRAAWKVVTVNSAPTVLASAFRDEWVHVADIERDDFSDPRQVRINRNFDEGTIV